MSYPTRIFLLTSLAAFAASAACADAPKDLNTCQKTVAAASTRYISAMANTVGSCLKKMSTAVIAKGATTAAAAQASAKPCVTAFRKLQNTSKPAKQLASQFDAKLGSKCDPALNPSLMHTAADVYTIGATTLSAGNLAEYCLTFGGNGAILSLSAWRDCLRAAAQCEARQAVALRWPRALEYFAALKIAILALPATAATTDALAALTTFDAALEGAKEDNIPDEECGLPVGLLVTGQTECVQLMSHGPYGSCPSFILDQDGDFRAGVPFHYTDNGDGTVTDLVTGLMWEKLSRDGGIHDVDFADTWSIAMTYKLGQFNTAGFAGHTDWRAPNRRELESLVHLGHSLPTIDPIFNTNCVPGCTVADCSCTSTGRYWSSTSYLPDANQAWTVYFADGAVIAESKESTGHSLRTVRGAIQ